MQVLLSCCASEVTRYRLRQEILGVFCLSWRYRSEFPGHRVWAEGAGKLQAPVQVSTRRVLHAFWLGGGYSGERQGLGRCSEGSRCFLGSHGALEWQRATFAPRRVRRVKCSFPSRSQVRLELGSAVAPRSFGLGHRYVAARRLVRQSGLQAMVRHEQHSPGS